MADPIKELAQNLATLYNNPDAGLKSKANEWLQDFQKTEEAWITADLILNAPDAPLESKLFAAQTFRAKISFDLDQLAPPHRLQLRDSLLASLTRFAIGPTKVILVQLCLALADLALQLPEWPTVVEDMIEKFGTNPETVPVLLEFLTVLPQEVVGNSKIKITNEWGTPRVSQLIPNTLSMYLGAQGITNPIKSQIFICLSAWLRAGEIATSAVGSTFILNSVFSALEDDALFEPAVDLLVDLIHETQEIDENMPIIEQVVSNLITLQPKLTQDREDPDKMRGYCRIYVEAGEWYTPLILRHPETFLPLVHAIRLCCDYEDLEVVGITFNFWYRLSKVLHHKKDDGNVKPLLDIYASLVETIIRHLHYPDDPDSQVGQEAEDFRRFRHDIGDTLKDCCYVLGASVCLKRSYDLIVQALENGSSAKWQDIEAPLFSMRTMGAEVDPRDDSVLPVIMDIIPRLPLHPKIRYATILVLCRYTEWTNFHPAGIPFQLQYISSGFEDPSQDVRLAAAQAMKFLCRDCAPHLVSYLPQLHTFYQTMSSSLDQDDMNEVTAALAHIVTALPIDQAAQAMMSFCMPLVESIHAIVSQSQPPSKQVYQNITEILERLDIFLSVISKPVDNKIGDQLPAECSKTVESVWGVLRGALSLYSNNFKVSERVCTVIRRGLNLFGPLCFPVLVNVLETMTTCFEASGCSSFLWITSKIVSLFPEQSDPLFQAAIKTAFEKQSTHVFPWVKDAATDMVSDVIDDYVNLLTALMESYPEMIITSPCFLHSFPVILASLETYDIGPLFATLNYIREILGHSSLDGTGSNGVSAPPVPAGAASLAEPIRAVINQHGYPLCEVLLRRLVTDFPGEGVSTAMILFRLLSDRFPTELSAWLPAVAERVPEKVASVAERQKFVLAFKEAMSQGRSELVKESVMSLVKASRRERARQRFNQDR